MKLIKKILVAAGILSIGTIIGVFIGFDSATPVEETEVIVDAREGETNIPEGVHDTTRKEEEPDEQEKTKEAEPVENDNMDEEYDDNEYIWDGTNDYIDDLHLSEDDLWYVGETKTIEFMYYDDVNTYTNEDNRYKNGTVNVDLTDIGIVYGDAAGHYYESAYNADTNLKVYHLLYFDFTIHNDSDYPFDFGPTYLGITLKLNDYYDAWYDDTQVFLPNENVVENGDPSRHPWHFGTCKPHESILFIYRTILPMDLSDGDEIIGFYGGYSIPVVYKGKDYIQNLMYEPNYMRH